MYHTWPWWLFVKENNKNNKFYGISNTAIYDALSTSTRNLLRDLPQELLNICNRRISSDRVGGFADRVINNPQTFPDSATEKPEMTLETTNAAYTGNE